MKRSKRQTIKSLLAAGTVVACLPNRWHTPLINSIVLPAHAQTSFSADCSGVDVEPLDQPISLTVTDTEILGPIAVSRTGDSFSSEQTSSLGLCSNNVDSLTQVTILSGVIQGDQNLINGTFIVRQYCGDVLACEQLTEYTVRQTPADSGSDLGVYEGRAVGTLRCCTDFL